MFSQEDFCAMAKDRPEMLRGYYDAVYSIIDLRQDLAKSPSGLWAKARQKKKQFATTFRLLHFPDRIVFNGQPLSEEEKDLVKQWIIEAANFHMLPKEDQAMQLEAKWVALEKSRETLEASLPPPIDVTTEAGRAAAAKFFSAPMDEDEELEERADRIFGDDPQREQWIAAQRSQLAEQHKAAAAVLEEPRFAALLERFGKSTSTRGD